MVLSPSTRLFGEQVDAEATSSCAEVESVGAEVLYKHPESRTPKLVSDQNALELIERDLIPRPIPQAVGLHRSSGNALERL